MKTFEERLEEAKEASACSETTSRLENMMWAYEYAEPGYTDPEEGKVIAFSNWNSVRYKDSEEKKEDFTMESLAELLEKDGHSVEWEDEWTQCSDCMKAIRTSPNSYDWTKYGYDDCENGVTICGDCVKEDPDEYIEWLKGDARKCNVLLSEDTLADYNYCKLEGNYETGLHQGMNDDPQKVAERLEELGVEDYIFNLSDKSQFYLTWEVFVHEDIFDGKYTKEELLEKL